MSLLSSARAQLLVIDAQERLFPAIANGVAALERIRILARAAKRLRVPIAVTEQYPKGLGKTLPSLSAEFDGAPVFEKTAFAASEDAVFRAHVATLALSGRDQIVLVGFEAHVCVLQTALGFRGEGLSVAIAADAIGARAPDSVMRALDRARDEGVSIVTTEMVVFEWLKTSAHPDFKALSALIR